MKTWTRQPNGTYKVTGAVTTRRVRLEIARSRDYKPVFPVYFRAHAEQLITDAIRKGQVRADAYRLVEVDGLPLDAAARARLAALRARSNASAGGNRPRLAPKRPAGRGRLGGRRRTGLTGRAINPT